MLAERFKPVAQTAYQPFLTYTGCRHFVSDLACSIIHGFSFPNGKKLVHSPEAFFVAGRFC